MSFFTSQQEKRLWLWTLAAVVAIYSTLGLPRTLAGMLRDHSLLEQVSADMTAEHGRVDLHLPGSLTCHVKYRNRYHAIIPSS